MKNKILPSRQFEIMNALWESKTPLLISELAKICCLSTPTVQYSIKALVKLGYVEVADIVHSNKVLARTYKTLVTKDQYLKTISEQIGASSKSKSLIALITEETEWEILDEVEHIINEKRKGKDL